MRAWAAAEAHGAEAEHANEDEDETGGSAAPTVPFGVAVFAGDNSIRSLVEGYAPGIVHWSEFDRGGHFAAMEAPDLLVEDVRQFFRRLR
jgi:hypothetical protein